MFFLTVMPCATLALKCYATPARLQPKLPSNAAPVGGFTVHSQVQPCARKLLSSTACEPEPVIRIVPDLFCKHSSVIVLNLSCPANHLFEGWFASGDAFAAQAAAGQIACPVCGSTDIERRPSAPYVNTGSSAPAAPRTGESHPASAPAARPAPSPELAAALISSLRMLGKQAEDVGAEFAEEARKIHYGEAEERSIRGQASSDEVGELLEEGILVLPLPPAEEDLH